jgi:hypothetical protein
VLPCGGEDSELAALEAEEAELDRQLAALPPPSEALCKRMARKDTLNEQLSHGLAAFDAATNSHSAKLECARQFAREFITNCLRRTHDVSVNRNLGEVTMPDVDAFITSGFNDPESISELQRFLTGLPIFKQTRRRATAQ